MLDALSRMWWLVAVRGLVAVIFGLLALVWPAMTLLALVLLFGGFALVDGVVAVALAVTGRRPAGTSRGWLAFEGLLGVAAGVVTFVWPDITTLALLWVIAFWAVVSGVFEVIAAVRLRRELRNEWLLALAGVASVVFGVILMVQPGEGALALVWLVGVYAIVFGIVLIGLGLRLRGIGQQLPAA
jgi:uncharacterized membrane protein HdeD (DUF308 family)